MYGDELQSTENTLELLEPLPRFPTTRFQGSKRKVLNEIRTLVESIPSEKVLDLYSGSGVVSLLFRYMGKIVTSNDFLLYNANTASLFISEDFESIDLELAKRELEYLLYEAPTYGPLLVAENYSGIYFIDKENQEIDRFCQNIDRFEERRKLYIYAVGQALIKKRPYNLFHRANLVMRTKDVKRSFGNAKTWETSILEHALKCILELKRFPVGSVSNKSVNSASCFNTQELSPFSKDQDIIYLDPPYMNARGAAVDYSDFYNFLEGLINYRLFSRGDSRYPHKPIEKKRSAWLEKDSAMIELQKICKYWDTSTIIMSYRSNGVPSPEEISREMSVNGRQVEIHSAGEYQYALSKNNKNEEMFIISKP